jgi:hypothetical protein
MEILAPISVGELYDKITILELKLEYIRDEKKTQIVKDELGKLESIRQKCGLPTEDELIVALKQVNRELWHIEEFKRNCEKQRFFDASFIEAARKVYLRNDLRASIKYEINVKFNSQIIEQKSHT